MVAASFNILFGLALMVLPGIYNFDESTGAHFYIIGPLIITFSITALWDVNRSARYCNMPCALYIVASPFLFNYTSDIAKWAAIVLGIVVFVLSFSQGKTRNIYGGGWRSLFQKNPKHIREANLTNK